jgi:UDP-3-O-[3-hydroxymyristoyl] glucosamine N-acyltransferase
MVYVRAACDGESLLFVKVVISAQLVQESFAVVIRLKSGDISFVVGSMVIWITDPLLSVNDQTSKQEVLESVPVIESTGKVMKSPPESVHISYDQFSVAVGTGVSVGTGVDVGKGVAVGVEVAVGVGVRVGPKSCPGAQPVKARLRTRMAII